MNYKSLIMPLVLAIAIVACSESSQTEKKKPNVVIIFLDDSGWEDFEPFGKKTLETPEVSKLAAEGCSYTNFYVPQAICSASRSALLSGCYPGRTKVFGAHGPRGLGLDTTFATMGEVFKAGGYATGFFGKWHIGDQDHTRPHVRGFDEAAGLMYSNDMWKYHPESPEYWGKFPIYFWENGEVINDDVEKEDQKYLTKNYTDYAVDFIKRHKDEPFLLYVPHSMPHVPLFTSPEFEGKSGQGVYGDVMLEIDWSVGQINKALKDNGVDDNTIVIFTSDNGPWVSYGNHAGSTPYRQAKGTSFDGGIRSACIMKYPPAIAKGSRSDNTLFTIDLLPTLCGLAGVDLPKNEIDGMDVWDLITNKPDAKNPHEYYAFSNGRNFEGIVTGDGNWKLHLPHSYRVLDSAAHDGMAGKYRQERIDTALFNMKKDPFETENRLKVDREVADELIEIALAHQDKFYAKK
ncbi:MAG: sulfatase [Cyclobacteriaceae bacterium]